MISYVVGVGTSFYSLQNSFVRNKKAIHICNSPELLGFYCINLIFKKAILSMPTLINLNYVGPRSVSKFLYYFYCVFYRSINARNKEILGLRKRRKKSPYTGLPNQAPQSSKPYL